MPTSAMSFYQRFESVIALLAIAGKLIVLDLHETTTPRAVVLSDASATATTASGD